jgi:hypothetical protein
VEDKSEEDNYVLLCGFLMIQQRKVLAAMAMIFKMNLGAEWETMT